MNKNEKNMNKNEKNMNKNGKNGKNIKLNQKRTMEPFLFKKRQKNIQKKTQKISKYLTISLMLFFKRGFVRLGSVLHIFLDHRKSKKISKKLKNL